MMKNAALVVPAHDASPISSETIRSLLQRIPTAIALLDVQGRVGWVNDEWVRIFRSKGPEFLGRCASEFLGGRTAASQVTGNGNTWIEKTVPMTNGTSMILQYNELALGPDQTAVMIKDVTDIRRSEVLLLDQRHKMARLEGLSELGEMAAAIAHEINNPLAIISALTQNMSIKSEAGELRRENVAEFGTKISAIVDRIARVVRGLRALARQDQNEPFSASGLSSILNQVSDICNLRCRKLNVNLIMTPVAPDPILLCRDFQIGQILINLINNAIDAVCESPGERWVKCEAEDEGANVRITVTDSGSGIPIQLREKIMEPFFTTKPQGKGTGLGLSVARSIAEMHGGTLELNPQHEHTQFVLRLAKSPGKGKIK